MKYLFSFFFLILFSPVRLFSDTILMFVSHEQTYYSEYIVMLKALQAAGYTVDVRSSSTDSASVYMVPSNTDIEETAGTLPNGSYSQFTTQFQNLFGSSWNASWNAMPSRIYVNGRIQDVASMSSYVGLVVVGGLGALEYRVDGSYSSQGAGDRLVSAAEIQSASEKLNSLALEALAAGKPVMAQCHGASIPVFWRIPSTSGPGEEALGFSLLKDNYATGFPEEATATTLSSLNVNHRTNDRVTVSSPHSSFNDTGNGDSKIITTRDWYPQTVAHAARTLINILETFPTKAEREATVSVLILHGGVVNTENCHYTNRANDIPCNYGGGANLPADYTDIVSLLNANSPNDDFNFTVTNVNITEGSLPFTASDQSSVLNYLNQFDAVVFYKHWSTGLTDAIQNALVSYADAGGGVLGLHHGLYHDIDGALDKEILVDELFGAESAMNTWSANLTTYNVVATDYGHFVSTYGISFAEAIETPSPWSSNALLSPANASFSYYQRFSIYDEIYNNMTFVAGQTFGRGVNQITPIFSNDQTPSSQSHTTGFVKHFDPSENGSVGKVAYYEIGERQESINIDHAFGQVVRNTIVWLSSSSTALPVEVSSFNGMRKNNTITLYWSTATEMDNYGFEIERRTEVSEWNTIGFVGGNGNSNSPKQYSFSDHPTQHSTKYFYRLKQIDRSGKYSYHHQIEVNIGEVTNYALLQNYPNPFNPVTTIQFTIPEKNKVTLQVLDVSGKEVALLLNEERESGAHFYSFDGSRLASGTYFLRLSVGSNIESRKMLLLK